MRISTYIKTLTTAGNVVYRVVQNLLREVHGDSVQTSEIVVAWHQYKIKVHAKVSYHVINPADRAKVKVKAEKNEDDARDKYLDQADACFEKVLMETSNGFVFLNQPPLLPWKCKVS